MAKKKIEKEKFDFEIQKRIKHCPNPTYYFNIGDNVQIGCLKNSKVINIFEDGKVYEIEYSYEKNDSSERKLIESEKKYVMWYEIRKLYKNKENNTFIKNEYLPLQYSQMTISSLLNKVYFFGVDFNPDYQRDYVWTMEDKVNLIDSIFNNIDIGKFVFVKNFKKDNLFECLDCKQRLTAICEYFEDRFSYKGKYFSDLSPREQNFFEEKCVSVAEVETDDKKTILKYFLMLNKSGKHMTQQDLAKVEKMLEELENKKG